MLQLIQENWAFMKSKMAAIAICHMEKHNF